MVVSCVVVSSVLVLVDSELLDADEDELLDDELSSVVEVVEDELDESVLPVVEVSPVDSLEPVDV